jgi:hypothetical protein
LTTITLSTVFRRVGDIRYRIIDDEAVVIRQHAGEVIGLNPTGARLLELIDSETSVEGLADALAVEFEKERAEIEGDVFRFLNELREAGVIEEISA